MKLNDSDDFSSGLFSILGTGFYLCVGGLIANIFSISRIKSQQSLEVRRSIQYHVQTQMNGHRFCIECGKELIQEGNFRIECGFKK